METYIAAIGALGAWLLVGGPLYQAATELSQEGLTQRRDIPDGLTPPRPVSGWWWLVPPIAYWKHHTEMERFRRDVLRTIPADQVKRMISFSTTARGWLVVACGATLFAFKETWELVEYSEWPGYLTWVITAVALLICVGIAAATASRTGKILSTLARSGETSAKS